MSDRTIASLSVDARLLYERLLTVNIGETITYADLNAVINRNVQNGARGALNTARRMAQRDHQVVFDAVHNAGLRRLADSEIVGTSDRVLAGIRRKAKKGRAILGCVADYQTLPDVDKVRHNATAAVLGVIEATAKERNVRQIEAHVKGQMPSLAETMQRTLEAFKGEKGGDK